MAYTFTHFDGNEDLFVAVMNKQEAEMVAFILANISGPEEGPRHVPQQILQGLSENGVDWYNTYRTTSLRGTIDLSTRAVPRI